MTSRLALVLLLFVFVASLTISSPAQTVTANLEGRVADTTGAVVPNATVTAVNDNTGVKRAVTTSPGGDYQLAFLPVGEYTVTAEVHGFKKQAKKVVLQISGSTNLDFSLAPGEVAQQVEVQGLSEAVEPTRTMVSSVIDERQIADLPVNGRQFIDFALLAPG